MDNSSKPPDSKIPLFKSLLILSILGTFGFLFPIYGDIEITPKKADFLDNHFSVSHQDTLFIFSNPFDPRIKVIKRIPVIVTAYSSSPDETDSDPEITASGEKVRDGICANNLLPLHTKIRIPKIFGNKIFSVEDRMNPSKSLYHVDIWFPSKKKALQFGTKFTYIEVLSIK